MTFKVAVFSDVVVVNIVVAVIFVVFIVVVAPSEPLFERFVLIS
jgi:hypothetical protein